MGEVNTAYGVRIGNKVFTELLLTLPRHEVKDSARPRSAFLTAFRKPYDSWEMSSDQETEQNQWTLLDVS